MAYACIDSFLNTIYDIYVSHARVPFVPWNPKE